MARLNKPAIDSNINREGRVFLKVACKQLKRRWSELGDSEEGTRLAQEMAEKATTGDYDHLLRTVIEYMGFHDFTMADSEEEAIANIKTRIKSIQDDMALRFVTRLCESWAVVTNRDGCEKVMDWKPEASDES